MLWSGLLLSLFSSFSWFLRLSGDKKETFSKQEKTVKVRIISKNDMKKLKAKDKLKGTILEAKQKETKALSKASYLGHKNHIAVKEKKAAHQKIRKTLAPASMKKKDES